MHYSLMRKNEGGLGLRC